ncbi:MAG: hypothetical protein WC471_03295 [Candidatus Woesearchaeota archaeon]
MRKILLIVAIALCCIPAVEAQTIMSIYSDAPASVYNYDKKLGDVPCTIIVPPRAYFKVIIKNNLTDRYAVEVIRGNATGQLEKALYYNSMNSTLTQVITHGRAYYFYQYQNYYGDVRNVPHFPHHSKPPRILPPRRRVR